METLSTKQIGQMKLLESLEQRGLVADLVTAAEKMKLQLPSKQAPKRERTYRIFSIYSHCQELKEKKNA